MSSENAHIATLRDRYTKRSLHEVTGQDKKKVMFIVPLLHSAMYTEELLEKSGNAYNGEPI